MVLELARLEWRKTLRFTTNIGFPVFTYQQKRVLDEGVIKTLGNLIHGVAAGLPPSSGLVLDLSNVEYISSTDLGKQIRTDKIIKHRNGTLVLCGLRPEIYEVYVLSQLIGTLGFGCQWQDSLEAVAKNSKPTPQFKSVTFFALMQECINAESAPKLKQEVLSLIQHTTTPILVIDCTLVKQLDDAAFDELQACVSEARNSAKKLVVTNIQPEAQPRLAAAPEKWSHFVPCHEGTPDFFRQLMTEE